MAEEQPVVSPEAPPGAPAGAAAVGASETLPPPVPGSEAQPATPPLAAKLADRPTACIIVGMAGSGKTTLMQRINHYALEQSALSGGTDAPTYYVHLDPAVRTVPFAAGVDIRDTVDYKQVCE